VTERLTIPGLFVTLKPIARHEIEMVRGWRNSPEVARYHAARDPISAAQQRAWFEQVSGSERWFVTVIFDRRTDRPIGVAHLKDIDRTHRRAECGLYIGETELRDNVFASEAFFLILEYAFAELELHKVYGHYLATNTRAARLNAGFGFEVEGRYRDELFLDGEWVDYVRVAVFRDPLLESPGARFFLRRRQR